MVRGHHWVNVLPDPTLYYRGRQKRAEKKKKTALASRMYACMTLRIVVGHTAAAGSMPCLTCGSPAISCGLLGRFDGMRGEMEVGKHGFGAAPCYSRDFFFFAGVTSLARFRPPVRFASNVPAKPFPDSSLKTCCSVREGRAMNFFPTGMVISPSARILVTAPGSWDRDGLAWPHLAFGRHLRSKAYSVRGGIVLACRSYESCELDYTYAHKTASPS